MRTAQQVTLSIEMDGNALVMVGQAKITIRAVKSDPGRTLDLTKKENE